MELRTQLRRAAGYFACNEALVHGERRFSFAEAWSRGVRLANALTNAGLRPGDKIELIPSYSDSTVFLHRQIYAMRDGAVEAVWDVAAAGMLQ